MPPRGAGLRRAGPSTNSARSDAALVMANRAGGRSDRGARPQRAEAARRSAPAQAAGAAARRRRCMIRLAARRRAGPRRFTGNPVSLDFQGADLARRAADVLRNQRPEHRHRSDGDTARWTSRCKDVPWDQALDIILRANKLGYTRRRHDRPHRAADRARRRRDAAAEARRSAGAGRRAAAVDQDAQLREGRGSAGAADEERAVVARHRAGRSADEHADHHGPSGSRDERDRA